MHTELYATIRLALRAGVKAAPEALSSEVLSTFENFEISECPYPAEGLLTSNVAFKLASQGVHGDKVLPDAIARSIAEHPVLLDPFDVRVGGEGYLNCSPRLDTTARFLCAMAQLPASTVFEHRTLLTDNAPLRRIPADRSVQWGAKRLGMLLPRRDEAIRFQKAIQLRGDATADDALMFLAVLSDTELDTSAYLRSLNGSENVPWYLRRFYSDAERARALVRAPSTMGSDGVLKEDSIRESYSSLFDQLSSGSHEVDALRWMLLVRETYYRGVSAGHPEQIFGYFLRGIRVFYTLFNRPENRQTTDKVNSPVFRLALYSTVLSSLTRELHVRLENCCEVLRSVLIAE